VLRTTLRKIRWTWCLVSCCWMKKRSC